ncbi:hypothetical protein [Phenylobacterium aquaticum]|uniref:hypothetical protein n=1 Tax=Phenylobacterium aquaticum TaxID=1763816 RepID=UPI0026EB6A65|nr:hypothetical protein [Phenylobacterium aquaticum]
MSEPQPKPDWRDGMLPTGILMVTLSGLCSGATLSTADPYMVAFTKFFGGVPILTGVILIGLGLSRRKQVAEVAYRHTRGDRIFASLQMGLGAAIFALSAVSIAYGMLEIGKAVLQHGNQSGGDLLGPIIVTGVFGGVGVFAGLAMYQSGQKAWR